MCSACSFIIVLLALGLDMFKMQFPSFTDTSMQAQKIIHIHHLYMLTKFLDLLDTVFFILRKKNSQVTLMHVYHHFSVPILAWTYFRLCGNTSIVVLYGYMNSFVHFVMVCIHFTISISVHYLNFFSICNSTGIMVYQRSVLICRNICGGSDIWRYFKSSSLGRYLCIRFTSSHTRKGTQCISLTICSFNQFSTSFYSPDSTCLLIVAGKRRQEAKYSGMEHSKRYWKTTLKITSKKVINGIDRCDSLLCSSSCYQTMIE